LAYDCSLFSFSKFLETLVYSPAICVLSPPLCDHTTPTLSTSEDSLPASRLNIVRHFSYASWVVSFSLSTVDDSFELQVPRLQVVADRTRSKPSETLSNGLPPGPSHSHTISEEKKALRKEILLWWQCVSERIDKLVRALCFSRRK
jgi:1-phosphatidylinositol-3-phosphate 5-kinase